MPVSPAFRWLSRPAANGPASVRDLNALGKRVEDVLGRSSFVATITALAYSASMTPALANGDVFTVTPTNATAFTVNVPSSSVAGHRIRIWVINTTGGALGALTFGAGYKTAGAWTQPAAANRRYIDFEYDGSNWYEVGRAAADIPN